MMSHISTFSHVNLYTKINFYFCWNWGGRKYIWEKWRTKKENKMKNTAEKFFKKSESFYKTRGIKYGQYNHNTAIL